MARAYRAKKDIGADDLRRRLRHHARPRGRRAGAPVRPQRRRDRRRRRARFTGPHSVVGAERRPAIADYTAERFLIAVGTRPYRPAHIGFDGENIVDSDEILELTRIPRQLVVVGASVIGVEYASIFSALDVKVTIIEPNNGLLPFLDRELADEFVHDLRERGVIMRFGAKVVSADVEGPQNCRLKLTDDRELRADMVLFSAGREGATDSLDLAACGLEADERGRLSVDKATFQTAAAAHLCRRRHHRLPEPGLDLDGAGPHRRLPRLRRAGPGARRSSSPMASIRCRRSRRSA